MTQLNYIHDIVFFKTSCVLVNVFGEVTGSTYSSLEDNTVLISDTTLYCVTENKNTPQVMWTHVDLAGVSTGVTSTTDASTGVSILQVYTTQPGYYSCEVTENGGSSRTYTAVMTDTNPDTGEYFIWAQCILIDDYLILNLQNPGDDWRHSLELSYVNVMLCIIICTIYYSATLGKDFDYPDTLS